MSMKFTSRVRRGSPRRAAAWMAGVSALLAAMILPLSIAEGAGTRVPPPPPPPGHEPTPPARPDQPPVEPRAIQLTVYNQDLALVRDTRQRQLSKGANEIAFADVAAQIDPTSVHLTSSVPGFHVLEQNYRYDLASSDAILQRHLDHEIEAMDKQGAVMRGTLLAHDAASLVVRGLASDEGVSILKRDELSRIDFPRLPEGLITRPTLNWRVDADRGGSQDLAIEYLTSGMNWHAEYVAEVAPASENLSLSAWVSIQNESGASYPEAKLKLIAGQVHRAEEAQPPIAYMGKARAAMDHEAPFEEKAFFEYHLYTLERPATVQNHEVKQITLFPTASVRSKRGYEYDASRDEKAVLTVLQFRNSKQDGLGMALPAGKVRVYQRDDDGGLEFVGEDQVDHTPKDENVRVRIGNAFDISAERAVTDSRRVSDRVNEEAVEVKLRNHKREAVTVTVIEHRWGDWQVLEKSHDFRKKDAYTLEFDVPVAPDAEAVLHYRVRTTM